MRNSPITPPAALVDDEAYGQVRALLQAGGVAVLTGAGVSTPSGIPDYRGRDGKRRVQPMQYSEFLADVEGRQRYWARAYAGWHRFQAARPNACHEAVACWQATGVLAGIITQNVDGLHSDAGANDVIELHGNLGRVVCLDCTETYPRTEVHRWLEEANPDFSVDDGSAVVRPDGDVVVSQEQVLTFVVALCPRCGSNRLKPDVVFFGGAVERQLVNRAFEIVDRATSLLVLGSSLKVMSGYRFVRRAASQGKPVAVITRGPTRGQRETTVHLDALLQDVLPTLARDLTR